MQRCAQREHKVVGQRTHSWAFYHHKPYRVTHGGNVDAVEGLQRFFPLQRCCLFSVGIPHLFREVPRLNFLQRKSRSYLLLILRRCRTFVISGASRVFPDLAPRSVGTVLCRLFLHLLHLHRPLTPLPSVLCSIDPDPFNKLSTTAAINNNRYISASLWAPNSRHFEHESIDEHDISAGDDTHHLNESQHSVEAKNKQTISKGKSRMTNKKTWSSTLDDLAETSRIIGKCMMEPPRIQISSSVYTIPEAISELETIPEVMDESHYEFYDHCTMVLTEKHYRETFMSIRKDRRLKWLQTRYEKRSG
ncbi:hypothetical protein KSP40_PGU004482 [Platanthera guangdongensis]|uniref:Uncharacterized protein n=1 Tax=Platanthera guangdongensis TaxID=2320717 RepID=A0ABR2N0Y1_9ASPA